MRNLRNRPHSDKSALRLHLCLSKVDNEPDPSHTPQGSGAPEELSMKFALKTCGCLMFMALVTGGCAASHGDRYAARSIAADQFVALTIVGPAPAQSADPAGVRLGAGDSLGQAVYQNYATIVRANPKWQFAGAESAK